jgi:hypothetical protein
MSTGEDPREELLKRIRDAKAKSSAFEEQSREREERRELERQIRFEENKVRDLPHVQAAEEEHGIVRVVNTPLGAIVLKRPNHLAYQQFMRRANSDKGMNEADIWRLVKTCIAYPDVARVEEITEEYPGVTIRLGNAVVELGNGEAEAVEGK